VGLSFGFSDLGIDYPNRLVSAARAPANPNPPFTVLTAGLKAPASFVGQKNARYPLSISRAFLARLSRASFLIHAKTYRRKKAADLT
jgi:hypothetical protein